MARSSSQKQELFPQAYVANGFNATEAAKEVGFSEKTAYSQGQRMLKNVEVQQAIKAIVDAKLAQLGIRADRVLEELAAVGFSNMRRLAIWGTEGMQLIDSEKLDEKDAAAVAKVKMTETIRNFGPPDNPVEIRTVRMEIKPHDKVQALIALAKHTGAVKDVTEHKITNKITEPIPITVVKVPVFIPAEEAEEGEDEPVSDNSAGS